MSLVQPPARPVPFSMPVDVLSVGFGQVVSSGLMKSSIVNGAFVKWLSNAGAVELAGSWQVVDSGGLARVGAFWRRQVYGLPAWSTWVVLSGVACATPSTWSPPTGPQCP